MTIPFLDRLQAGRRILLCGAGGGYDVFCAVPLFHWLRSLGKQVDLVNLSFSDLSRCGGEFPLPTLLRVEPDTSGPRHYFPEKHLSVVLQHPVYAIHNGGPAAAGPAYDWLVSQLQPDTLVLVDGGTDILTRGDEAGLGTPEEDYTSLLVCRDLAVEQRLLACLGFGVDSFHGVCHAHVLENIADLSAAGHYLGCWPLLEGTPEEVAFRDACQYTFRQMPERPSIVNGSILDAVAGRFGDVHSTGRTRGSRLFINPLMSTYWGFELAGVAAQNYLLPHLSKSASREELSLRIEELHACMPRHRQPYPIPD